MPGNNGYPDPNFFVSSGNIQVDPFNVDLDTVTNFMWTTATTPLMARMSTAWRRRPSSVTGGTITNLPGSVWIAAQNLDLTGARMNANGLTSIRASHLISSTNFVIDCQNLLFDLGSTNGHLLVTNLAGAGVAGRIQGQISAWSAVWSNSVVVVLPQQLQRFP